MVDPSFLIFLTIYSNFHLYIEKGCDDDHGSGEDAPELGMGNVGGVFLVLITGLGLAFFVGILEFFWNVSRVAVDEVVSLHDIPYNTAGSE